MLKCWKPILKAHHLSFFILICSYAIFFHLFFLFLHSRCLGQVAKRKLQFFFFPAFSLFSLDFFFIQGVWDKCGKGSYNSFSCFLNFSLPFLHWVFWTGGSDCVGMAWYWRLLGLSGKLPMNDDVQGLPRPSDKGTKCLVIVCRSLFFFPPPDRQYDDD